MTVIHTADAYAVEQVPIEQIKLGNWVVTKQANGQPHVWRVYPYLQRDIPQPGFGTLVVSGCPSKPPISVDFWHDKRSALVADSQVHLHADVVATAGGTVVQCTSARTSTD